LKQLKWALHLQQKYLKVLPLLTYYFEIY
jgi:hypothetical protein